jgi:hypothetical protein
MTENMQADVQQSRQAVFVRCCLNAEKIPKREGNAPWDKQGIRYILSNEKYIADCL